MVALAPLLFECGFLVSARHAEVEQQQLVVRIWQPGSRVRRGAHAPGEAEGRLVRVQLAVSGAGAVRLQCTVREAAGSGAAGGGTAALGHEGPVRVRCAVSEAGGVVVSCSAVGLCEGSGGSAGAVRPTCVVCCAGFPTARELASHMRSAVHGHLPREVIGGLVVGLHPGQQRPYLGGEGAGAVHGAGG